MIIASAQILSSTPLLEGDATCPGQTVIFTCQTTGALAWSSAEYFGTSGRQPIFGFGDRAGSTFESVLVLQIAAHMLY